MKFEQFHFELEYSVDALNWEKIGRIEAMGERSLTNKYNYKHIWNRNFTLHYYRLKMVDLDESFEYSMIRSIQTGSQANINVFPNPFTQKINVSVPGDFFEVRSAEGVVMYISNESSEILDLSGLPSGVYFILYKKDGRIFTEKLLKQRL